MSKKETYQLTKHKFLSIEEQKRLKEILRDCKERDQLIVELALATGARAKELLAIRRKDLDDLDRTVYIKGLKNSFDREIPISEKLFKRLKKYSKSTGPIFNISYSMLYKIWVWIRPIEKPFHSLRHTFAINLYKQTRDIKLVQTALGHKSIANTMIYADYQYRKTELRKLVLNKMTKRRKVPNEERETFKKYY